MLLVGVSLTPTTFLELAVYWSHSMSLFSHLHTHSACCYFLGLFLTDQSDGSYADGLWHDLKFSATQNHIELVIDNKDFITTRNLVFEADSDFYIGGVCSI